jgi:hypothetical protein
MDGQVSISSRELYAAISTGSAPTVIDARRAAAFDADDKMIVAAQRLPPKVSGPGGTICRLAAGGRLLRPKSAAKQDANIQCEHRDRWLLYIQPIS